MLEAQDPARNGEPIFSEQRTKLVGQRRSLFNHNLTCIPKRLDILLFCGFYRNKVNTWAKRSLANCQRIIGIIFLAADESFHVLGGDESDAIEGSPPEVLSGAGLHCNKSSGFELSDSIRQFVARDFFVPCDGAIDHPDAYLKNRFWTDPTPVDKFCPHDWACSKASGLTPPR